MSTVWNKLSVIDVSEHVEKKNGMSYLSWAYAWQTLKDNFPDATFEKHCNDMGYPCFYDPAGFAFVKVTVSAGGHSQTETFPVLDFKNKGVQGPDSFQVNTALQRALTKAIGYLGLGFYIYAGEDLPTSSTPPADPVASPPPTRPAQSPAQPAPKMADAGATNQEDDFLNYITAAIKSCGSVDDLRDLYSANTQNIKESSSSEVILKRFAWMRDHLSKR
jgi:hypothetical protein